MPPLGRDDLRDALRQLKDWNGDARELHRALPLDESEHAAFTERVKVVADALQLTPHLRRSDGYTHVSLRTPHGGTITDGEIRLAARIEDAYRAVTQR